MGCRACERLKNEEAQNTHPRVHRPREGQLSKKGPSAAKWILTDEGRYRAVVVGVEAP